MCVQFKITETVFNYFCNIIKHTWFWATEFKVMKLKTIHEVTEKHSALIPNNYVDSL
jgi:hypothetical protein